MQSFFWLRSSVIESRLSLFVAKVYQDTLETCLKYPNFISLETWGVSDAYTWLRLFPPVNLADARPLLFDENYQRKAAYYAIIEALKGKPSKTTK